MTTLTHLECGLCGTVQDADRLWNLCPECDKPLLARYDLAAARQAVSREEIAGREDTLWRYREVLPVRDAGHILCLGEGWTPLVHAERLGQAVGFDHLYIKDEGLNPTASFKADSFQSKAVVGIKIEMLFNMSALQASCKPFPSLWTKSGHSLRA